MAQKEEKTLVRKFPVEIDDEDIELVMKEWMLAGYELRDEGNFIAGVIGSEGPVFTYQKVGDRWIWIDTNGIDRCLKHLKDMIREREHVALVKRQAAQLKDQTSYGGTYIDRPIPNYKKGNPKKGRYKRKNPKTRLIDEPDWRGVNPQNQDLETLIRAANVEAKKQSKK